MSPDAEVGTTTLRHNPLNAVTATVERVTYAEGRTLIRKELRRPANPSSRKPVDSDRQWTSRGFLRDYSTTRDVPWDLVDDDAAWRQPLVAETWPPGLREAWRQLLAHRNELLDLVARLPRARCHLDLWVSNVIQRPTGELALLDWAFTGDGALGEDLGNHIPDAVFDLFWPAERLPELAETCVDNYLDGLREAGWRGSPDDVRRAVMASGVKYAWLLPGLLARASDASHKAYHQQADSHHLFHQRGQALAFVADWCAQALKARP